MNELLSWTHVLLGPWLLLIVALLLLRIESLKMSCRLGILQMTWAWLLRVDVSLWASYHVATTKLGLPRVISSSIQCHSTVTEWSGALRLVRIDRSTMSLAHACLILRLRAAHLLGPLLNLLGPWRHLSLWRATLRNSVTVGLLLWAALASIGRVRRAMLVIWHLWMVLSVNWPWCSLLLWHGHLFSIVWSLLLLSRI